jgi:hypothetical protein
MGKLLVLAGVALMVVVGATRVGELQSGLASLKSYVSLDEVNEALETVAERAERTAFFARANRVCAGNDQARLPSALSRKPARFVRILRRRVRDEQATLGDLSELEPPQSLESTFARFLDDRREVLLAADRLIVALEARKRSASLRALREVARTSSTVNAYARAQGMPACEM